MANIPYERLDQDNSHVTAENGDSLCICLCPSKLMFRLIQRQNRPLTSQLTIGDDGKLMDYCLVCNKMVISVSNMRFVTIRLC